jgi:hypothetical protein
MRYSQLVWWLANMSRPCAPQASNLTKALDYTRKYFKQAMTVKGTFEDFAEATALARPCPLRARQMVCHAALLSARSRSAVVLCVSQCPVHQNWYQAGQHMRAACLRAGPSNTSRAGAGPKY